MARALTNSEGIMDEARSHVARANGYVQEYATEQGISGVQTE